MEGFLASQTGGFYPRTTRQHALAHVEAGPQQARREALEAVETYEPVLCFKERR